MIETSLEGDDLNRAMEYAISGKINTNLNKQYLLVTRENEYVVLQYYIGSQFTNEWLYENFFFAGNPALYSHRDKLYCSMYDINSKVCKKYAGAAFTTF